MTVNTLIDHGYNTSTIEHNFVMIHEATLIPTTTIQVGLCLCTSDVTMVIFFSGGCVPVGHSVPTRNFLNCSKCDTKCDRRIDMAKPLTMQLAGTSL